LNPTLNNCKNQLQIALIRLSQTNQAIARLKPTKKDATKQENKAQNTKPTQNNRFRKRRKKNSILLSKKKNPADYPSPKNFRPKVLLQTRTNLKHKNTNTNFKVKSVRPFYLNYYLKLKVVYPYVSS
jgi:hypothetical protein